MPESLAGALEDLGHEVDSVNSLKLKGIDNGTLYRQVAVDYELCFTRDAGFARNVRQMRDPSLSGSASSPVAHQPASQESQTFLWEFFLFSFSTLPECLILD